MANYKNLFIVAYLGDIFCSNIYNNVYRIKLDETIQSEYVSDVILEFIQYYIEKGGFSHFEFDEFTIVTDNIIILRVITETFIEFGNQKDKLIEKVKKNMKNIFDIITKEDPRSKKKKILFGGNFMTTESAMDKLNKKNNNYHSDICVKIIPVGVFFSEENELEKLIDVAIKITKLTHNNVIGIMAGITSAYFISLAVRKIDISKWIFLLIELLESDLIKKNMDLDDNDVVVQYMDFLRYFRTYRDEKFNEGKVCKAPSDASLVFKWKNYKKYMYTDFDSNELFEDVISCLIISYDALLECDGYFEKIIYYAFLLPGRIMSIGGFVGALYGLVYGVGDVPKHMIKYLDSIGVLEKIEKFSDLI